MNEASALAPARRVALVTLGCARNEVDSEELAARLAEGGWSLVEDAGQADAIVVNTCGFIEAAKKDSVDALLAAADLKTADHAPAVIAVGCMAERYGAELARELPEADAVLSFDDYADIAAVVDRVVHGERPPAHTPQDRRLLLPVSPVERQAAVHGPSRDDDDDLRGRPASGPPILRQRLGTGPVASLKLASGCDRRCTFCAIPSFRGSFLSRRPHEVLAEAQWLASQGVRELVLVSENSTSYGKDFGELRALEELLPTIAEVEGIARVRVAYLQPAEMRPGLVTAIAATPSAADYYDLSFQHSSATVLRRMRRFGDTDSFLDLISTIRAAAPQAGIRSNVIVGFPGETLEDLAELERFLTHARLDAIGVFGYSDEEGTEAVDLPDKVDPDEVRRRVEQIASLADELVSQRAEDRIGETVDVLVESIDPETGNIMGRAAHQGPETDGEVTVLGVDLGVTAAHPAGVSIGDLVLAVVTDSDGADLVADARPLVGL